MATPATEQYGQIPPYPWQAPLVVFDRESLTQYQGLTAIGPKFRVFYIIAGISYLFYGTSLIGLEVAILMYSNSKFYRGIWAGALMLQTGIYVLADACQASHSISYLVRFLFAALFCTAFAIFLSCIEIFSDDPCVGRWEYVQCDSKLGKMLKIIIISELSLAMVHNIINLLIAGFARSVSLTPLKDPSPPIGR